jgi:AcrR family transcriptional regulator
MLSPMGNREDLIAGAKRCLLAKGYAATTARDIAAASGVSLAAIGYHFGSKDALMNQAVFDSIGDWASELQAVLAAAGLDQAAPARRFELVTEQTLEAFAHDDGLWAGQLELVGLAKHHDGLREFLAGIQVFAGQGLAQMFVGIDPEADPEAARLAGPVMHALLIGLIAKYFLDPAQAPTAAEFTAGLKVICERLSAQA